MTTEPDHPQGDDLQREALGWLSRISLGGVTRDELAALRRWRDTSPAHAAALARAGLLWRQLEMPVAALAREEAGAGRGFQRPSRRLILAGGGAAAAAVAGILAVRPPYDLWPSAAELAADYRTGTGEQRHLAVVEAVSVDLNTRTSIAVNGSGREPGIELIAGETAIAVGHAVARPFIVTAAEGRITARLATFNVRRLGEEVDLACIDGEVAVECAGRAVVVRSAQRVAYGARGLGPVVSVDTAVVTAWREGMLVFRSIPLAAVIAEVNRYRPGRIVLMDGGLGQRLVTARFEIKRLDTVMEQIGAVFKVRVRTLPGGLVLVG